MQTPATTLLATLIAATLTASCGDEAVEPEPTTPTTLTISPASATLQSLADTVRLTATVKNQHGQIMANVPATWSSSDPATATVDASGLVTAVSNGTATVTASASSASATATMTVEQVPADVLIDPDSLVLVRVGDTARVVSTFRDANGHAMPDPEVHWQSADTVVATVDASGLVTAVANGMAAVSANAGSVSGSATVTVGRADTITLSPPGDTIATGDTLRLTAAAYDQNGQEMGPSKFSWTSSDASVLRVDESGLVTAVAEGQARITAILGHARATAEITVWLPDRAALVALYNATDGPNWVDNTNWLTDAPLGEWYGVSTNSAGRVVRLALGGSYDNDARETVPHGLSGPIPPELGDLSSLETLALYRNRLWGPIPPELGDLSNLTDLDLSLNALSGAIPPELGNLPNLRSLGLRLNALSGAIPPELGNLPNLRSLRLRGNALSGAIPPELGNLPNLRSLDLSVNALSGAIPPELGNLPNLRSLNLGLNALSGAIPPELGDLSNLTDLGLHLNDFSGAIPQSFLQLDLLWRFSFDRQEVCVPGFPAFVAWFEGIENRSPTTGAFCNASDQAVLTSFFQLAAGSEWAESGGWLGGPALEEWHGVETDTLGRVTALVLSDNGLSGSLPGVIAGLGQLARLHIDGNEVGGRLPLSLTALDLDEFHYDGTDLCEPAAADFRDWLDGIPSHRGTGIQCRPLTERDALAALYGSTGGPSWTNGSGWLTEAPLRRWAGVEVDARGRVVGLQLWRNGLSGVIPPELGDLSNLEDLDLGINDLSGPIPPELGDLSSLRDLILYGNDLSGAIPPELGDLSNLRLLALNFNDLSGAIPPELGDLSNLTELVLNFNDLSGAIPPELGALSNLTRLILYGNDLSGRIPPELGNLANLERMHISQNDLSGPIPPTFGGLASLTELELSHNPGLAGALPAGMSDLALESLVASGTNLCMPREPAFEEWLATIPKRRIAACGEPPAAYLVQAVQSRAHPVPLVAGEDAPLRVFVTAAMETTEGMPEVRARFFLNGTERHVVDIPRSSTPIPTEIDEGNLAMSANAEIPGRIVRPSLEMLVEIDPGGVLDADLGVPKRIPQEGRLAVEVREMPVLDLTVIPFLWSSDPDSAIIGIVEGMAGDPEGHALLEDTHVLLPVGDIDVTAHAPVVSTSNTVSDVLAQTEAIRLLEGGGGHYKGMMSEFAVSAGMGYLPGRSSVSWPSSGTIAHELGHNMRLWHAPCGGAGGPDLSFPYPDGTIGTWGYDFGRARLVPAWLKDHMSYCGPAWTSDYHFTNALRHRLSDEGPLAAVLAAAPARSLLLWGGIDATGTPFLNPAFVADAPPTLPDSAGAYALTGRGPSGGELFSLNFVMPEVPDGDGGSSFVFALPVQAQWEDELATITLSGPEGTVTLDGDTDIPMAILRDPVTGHVRGFLRDLPPQTQAAMDAAERAIEPGLQVLFSRGIPDPTEWRR